MMKMRGEFSEQGFSLVEVLFAITILAIGLLAVATMQTTAMHANTISRDGTVAVQMAEEIIERFRVNSGNFPERYDNLATAGTGCDALIEPAKGDCVQWRDRLVGANLRNASGTVDVIINSPMVNSSTATVTVQWGDGQRIQMTTILETWGI